MRLYNDRSPGIYVVFINLLAIYQIEIFLIYTYIAFLLFYEIIQKRVHSLFALAEDPPQKWEAASPYIER